MTFLIIFVSLFTHVHSTKTFNPESIRTHSRKSMSEQPYAVGSFNFMEHHKNFSLENITETIKGISYVEEWRDIIEYENRYQISSFGRIKSFHLKEHILHPYINGWGYVANSIFKEKKKTVIIHILVLKHFKDIVVGKNKGNHIDGKKFNNHYSNLEWCTWRENNIHAYEIGLKKGAMIGVCGVRHYKSKPTAQIDIKTGEVIKIWESANLAAIALNGNNQNISHVCNGTKNFNTAYGYKWKYV